MAIPRKLLSLIKGKVPHDVRADSGTAYLITFKDGWKLRIDTAKESRLPITMESAISHIDQTNNVFAITYENKVTDTMTLADPASSILVRDETNTLQYTD